MPRRAIALVAFSIAAVVVIAACQDYNLNPVGSCLIQPGSRVVPLDNLSTADILFVVDDSQSMTPKQNQLATAFSDFVGALAAVQADRKSKGMDAFDFYVAVTSSSIFEDDGGNPRTTYANPLATSGANPCSPGPAVAGVPYPDGTFLSDPTVTEKVLKFTKDLDWTNWTTDATIQDLITKFGKNIHVGSCGSNQEQPLQAGRRAIEKTLAGQQPIQAGDFLHANSKLVVVFVSDEDDCSNPMTTPLTVTRDHCNEWPAAAGLYPLTDYTSFFTGLGRPFGAAFIIAASCSGGNCTPQVCSGGYSYASNRSDALADSFKSSGYSVVEDSVCGSDFGSTLIAIANLVLPPATLKLPSQPAASEITMVRIIDTNGNQRRVCTQATSSGETGTAGWWFTTDNAPTAANPSCDENGSFGGTTPTRCVYINHNSTTSDCEAGPGETYSAEYLGVVPPGGCNPSLTTATDCATYLAGDASKADLYECYTPTGASLSTCLCK